MTNKFQIGDKVRVVTNETLGGRPAGAIGKVQQLLPGRTVNVDFDALPTHPAGRELFHEYELALVARAEITIDTITAAHIRAYADEIRHSDPVYVGVADNMLRTLRDLAASINEHAKRPKWEIGARVRVIRGDVDVPDHVVGEVGIIDAIDPDPLDELSIEVRFTTRGKSMHSLNEWFARADLELLPRE